MHTYYHTYMHTRVPACLHACTHTCVQAYMHTYTYACILDEFYSIISFADSEKRLCRDWRLGRDSSAVLQVLCDLLQKVVLRESNSTYT